MREVRSWRDENGTNWRSFGNACWFTNLDIAKRHEELILYKNILAQGIPDSTTTTMRLRFPDIRISQRTTTGRWACPITFLDHYNPDQFEILGLEQDRLTLGLNVRSCSEGNVSSRVVRRFYLSNGRRRIPPDVRPARHQEQAAMKIELKEITIKKLTDGFADNAEAGRCRVRWQARHSPAVSAGIHLQGQAAGCGDR